MEENMIEQFTQRLGCPCQYFAPMEDDGPLMAAYREARARGAREGFTPLLIAIEDHMMEFLEEVAPETDRRQLLAQSVQNGKTWLENQRREYREMMDECDLEWDEEDTGAMEGGEAATAFSGYWSFGERKTYPVVLAEIPTAKPWEIFAWMPFGGWNECPASAGQMAMAKYWYEQYGAVPAVMTFDVLEYDLPTPVPEEKALEVAKEQYLFCTDIVDQGIGTVGALADTLRQSTVWFFWWD